MRLCERVYYIYYLFAKYTKTNKKSCKAMILNEF